MDLANSMVSFINILKGAEGKLLIGHKEGLVRMSQTHSQWVQGHTRASTCVQNRLFHPRQCLRTSESGVAGVQGITELHCGPEVVKKSSSLSGIF